MTDEKGHITPYYNGMERIASRLGDQNISINVNDPELQDRKDWQDSLIRKNIVEITGYEFLEPGEEQTLEDPKPVFELPQVGMTGLQPIGGGDVFYYHPNHLGSTCYVTDGNASVQQGFLYAPFGEITNEHNSSFGNGVIPKYSFNAKELDEETGMYYYEARYYAPPVFISRDPLFEKYPTFSPYAYCANNPVNVIDPDGREWDLSSLTMEQQNTFNNSMNSLCEDSPLFSEIYCTLTNSAVTYKPYIGETQDDAPAQFNSSDNTIAFLNEQALASANEYVEEFIHAYQLTENKNIYNQDNDFNYEFEAKLIKTLVFMEASRGYGTFAGMEKMFEVIQCKYDFGSALTYKNITSIYFHNLYISEANNYANYNEMHNVGNTHYKQKTSQSPASLILLMKNTRP